VKSLTFYFPYHDVSGVPVLFSRIADYLARERRLDVRVVDFADGYMARTLKGSPAAVQRFEADVPFDVPAETVLVMQGILPATIRPELRVDANTRLLFWNLHAMNFVQTVVPTARGRYFQSRYLWLQRLVNRSVLRSFTRRMTTFVHALAARKSLVFVDGPTYQSTCERLEIDIPDPVFVPVPIPVPAPNPMTRRAASDPLRVAWVGRLDDFKVSVLAFTMRKLSDLARRAGRSVQFDIVGDGPLAGAIDRPELLHAGFTVRRRGVLVGDLLDRFLLDEVDLLMAMGASALEGGRLGVPSVLLDYSYGPVPDGYRFRWLFESERYALGAVIDDRRIEAGNRSLDAIADRVRTDFGGLSRTTHEYCLRAHGMAAACDRFLAAAADASFRWRDMDPLLRRKSPLRRAYESFRSRRTRARLEPQPHA
jgi:hypothetical protein